jgi:hypothetical protein
MTKVRRLEPHEWEWILGFPAGWTDPLGQSQTDVSEIFSILDSTRVSADLPRGPQGHLQFDYNLLPHLFQGEQGWGPLRAGLDTNILIDYVNAGSALWAENPSLHPSRWRDRRNALADLLTVWTWRDIRLIVFKEQLADARKRLSTGDTIRRERLLDAFYTAFWEAGNWHTEPIRADGYHAEDSIGLDLGEKDISFIRHPFDRLIVRAALRERCHILLTEDKRHLLKHQERLSQLGLIVLRPADLLMQMWESGELTMARCVSGLVPDNHAMVHLIEASSLAEG